MSEAVKSDDTLTVLLGAGASYDCAHLDVAGLTVGWKPPLVDQLFYNRSEFTRILSKYQKATLLSDQIRSRLARHEHLEEILGDLAQASLAVRRCVWEMSLYFQELLGEVSLSYVRGGPTKFDTLISVISQSRFRNVLILTVNYDTLVERAITRAHGNDFRALDRYSWNDDEGQRWALVKLHGSTTWGRRLVCGAGMDKWDTIIGTLTELKFVDEKIIPLQSHRAESRVAAGGFCYPALALPLRGKTFVCPDEHVDIAEGMLERSSHLMVAGFSGLDENVLGLFRRASRLEAVKIVDAEIGEDRLAPDRALAKFRPLGGAFESPPEKILYRHGFQKFVDDGEIDKFLGVPVRDIVRIDPMPLGGHAS